VVVGRSNNGTNDEAFRWTQAGGMLSVANWLSTAAWTILAEATATNRDGSLVVGYGTNTGGRNESFIARVGGSTGIVGLTDLSNSLAVQVTPHVQLEGLTALTLNGAHHRPLMAKAVAGSVVT
jgi:uncharacterized membrane protein